jgi:SOS-response transcriptional repressor LexA
MHDTMERLYAAAKALKEIEGQSDLARFMNISPQRINNWEARGISMEGALLAQRAIGCSADFIITGEGGMTIYVDVKTSTQSQPAWKTVHYEKPDLKMVPLISDVQAGAMAEAIDPYPLGDAEKWIPYIGSDDISNHAFALRVKGESMLPDFSEGDIIIVDPAVEPQPGRFVVAKNGENEATFKQYRQRGHNEKGVMVVELVPMNSNYPTIRSDITPIKIIGTVVYVTKSLTK